MKLLQTRTVFLPAVGDRDADDRRSSNLFPPTDYLQFLRSPDIKIRIGAHRDFVQCDNNIKSLFALSGEVRCR